MLLSYKLQSREGGRKLAIIEHLLYADTALGAFIQIVSHTVKHKQSTDLKPEKDKELRVMLMPLAPLGIRTYTVMSSAQILNH